jgi:hypothetical protein
MLLTERAIRQLIYNILLEGVREDADALRSLLADAPDALSQFEPLSMKPKWMNWLADRYVRNKYPSNDTLEDALPLVSAFAAADAAISQKYSSNPQFKTAVDTSFPPSERKWTNPADAAAMSTADMDLLLAIYRRPKDKLGIDRADTSWKNDKVGTFGPWELYLPTSQQNSINIAGADPVTHKPYTDWCTARTSGENLFYNYAAQGTMLFYAINTEAPTEVPESRISLGFLGGNLDVSGEYGGITVNAANTGLKSAELKRIFGDYYTSIIARSEEVIAKHGGIHPIDADMHEAAKDLDKFNSMLRGLGDSEAGNLASSIFSGGHRKSRVVSPEVAVAAANHKYAGVRAAIARNKRIDFPESLLMKLGGDADSRVRISVAGRQDLPESLFMKLLRDDDRNVRIILLSRRDMPESLMMALADDPDVKTRLIIARKDDLMSVPLLMKLADDSDSVVRQAVANQLYLPESLLMKLAGDSSHDVRNAILSRPNLPEFVFLRFAKDANPDVRVVIASNHSLPESAAIRLAMDSDKNVRFAVARNFNLTQPLVIKLASDADADVRRAVSRRLDLHTLPEPVLMKLATDPDSEVRASIVRKTNLPKSIRDAAVREPEKRDVTETRRLAYRILREIKRSARI